MRRGFLLPRHTQKRSGVTQPAATSMHLPTEASAKAMAARDFRWSDRYGFTERMSSSNSSTSRIDGVEADDIPTEMPLGLPSSGDVADEAEDISTEMPLGLYSSGDVADEADDISTQIRLEAADGLPYTEAEYMSYYGEEAGPRVWEDRLRIAQEWHSLECRCLREREDAQVPRCREIYLHNLEQEWAALEADGHRCQHPSNSTEHVPHMRPL